MNAWSKRSYYNVFVLSGLSFGLRRAKAPLLSGYTLNKPYSFIYADLQVRQQSHTTVRVRQLALSGSFDIKLHAKSCRLLQLAQTRPSASGLDIDNTRVQDEGRNPNDIPQGKSLI